MFAAISSLFVDRMSPGTAPRPAPRHVSTSISSKTQIAAFCQCSPACSDA